MLRFEWYGVAVDDGTEHLQDVAYTTVHLFSTEEGLQLGLESEADVCTQTHNVSVDTVKDSFHVVAFTRIGLVEKLCKS